MKKFKAFDDSIFDKHPDLRQVLKPRDHYPELIKIFKIRSCNFPDGTLNTKVIINEGKIVERVYKTPKGEFITLFPKASNIFLDQAA